MLLVQTAWVVVGLAAFACRRLIPFVPYCIVAGWHIDRDSGRLTYGSKP